MTRIRSALARITAREHINFLLTNRIPRRLATRLFGWFSQIENPLVRDVSISIWRLFSDLDLSEATDTHFRSLHHCFVRSLKEGCRPIDPDPDLIVAPCDAIVGASGEADDGQVLQIKGFPYELNDLLGDREHAAIYRNGCYVTMRLTSSMYHRFHAPHDCQVESVTFISGDRWNVNPATLKRVKRLFCRNERALIRTRLLRTGHAITLVPVGSILVASIRLSFMDARPDRRGAAPETIRCSVSLRKGEEMGWFQHGSTIVLFAPAGFVLSDNVREGCRIQVGQPLMRLPATTGADRDAPG